MKASSKNRMLGHGAFLVLLALFNAISFVAPFERSTGFWISYVFSTAAILLADVMTFYALERNAARSRFYGLPLVYVAWGHLAVQLVLGFVFMAAPGIRALASVPAVPSWLIFVISALMLGVCLIGLLAAETGSTEIRRIDGVVEEKVFYIKSLSADIRGLTARSEETSLKEALLDLAETMRFSDPMSDGRLAALENKIETKSAVLGESVAAGNTDGALALCDELRRLLAERNRKCKLFKNNRAE
jgi:hypothetical protein